MPSTYSGKLRLELMANGENDSTWGTKANTNLELLEAAIAGRAAITHDDSASYTLTANNGSSDEARQMMLNIGGTLTAARNTVVPTTSKLFQVKNATTGGFATTVKTSAGTGISVPNGKSTLLMCDGTNVVDAINWLSALTIAGALAVGGALTASSTLAATGDFSVNTNKFTVTASNGNTVVAGTLSAQATTVTTLTASGESSFTGGAVRIQGDTTPASGAGLEMRYNSGSGLASLLAYDRTGAAYKKVQVDGSEFKVLVSSSTVGLFSSTGLAVTGTATASNAITSQGGFGFYTTEDSGGIWSNYTSTRNSGVYFPSGTTVRVRAASAEVATFSIGGVAVTGTLSTTSNISTTNPTSAAVNQIVFNDNNPTYRMYLGYVGASAGLNASRDDTCEIGTNGKPLTFRPSETETIRLTPNSVAVTGTLSATGAALITGQLASNQTSTSVVDFSSGSNAMRYLAFGTGSNAAHIWYQGKDGNPASQTMTLDSIGNLLVGKTSGAGYRIETSGAGITGNGSVSVGSASATTIFTTPQSTTGNFIVVYGDNGSDGFMDILFFLASTAPQIISSKTLYGTPGTRTYTASASNLQAQLSAGSMSLRCAALTPLQS